MRLVRNLDEVAPEQNIAIQSQHTTESARHLTGPQLSFLEAGLSA